MFEQILGKYAKYLPYLTMFSNMVNKFKAAKTGQTAVVAARGSIDGHQGEYFMGFAPDTDTAAVTALHDLEGVSMDL